MSRRTAPLWSLLVFPIVAFVGACTEDIETGDTCPVLCPGQEIVLFDTVLTPAYVFDSTLGDFPIQGLEDPLLLADRRDSLDVRAVIRFDTLVREWVPPGADSAETITYVDSAFLSFRLWNGGIPMTTSAVIEAYDVFDSTVVDSIRSDLLPLFTQDRVLGRFEVDSTFVDSTRVRIPIDSAYLREIIGDPARRLRIGLWMRSRPGTQEMRLSPYFPNGDGPSLEYSVTPDTTLPRVVALQPTSATPSSPPLVGGDFIDFSIVASAPDIRQAGTFSVGGLPANRAYLRFDLPLWLTDSVGILRARLELTQDPLSGVSTGDTVRLLTHLVLAGSQVSDLRRAATLLSPSGFLTNTLELVPSDSGVVVIEMNALVRQWNSPGGGRAIPNAIVFRTDSEGASPLGLRFFGASAADPSLRPRLRVSYTPSKTFGRP